MQGGVHAGVQGGVQGGGGGGGGGGTVALRSPDRGLNVDSRGEGQVTPDFDAS